MTKGVAYMILAEAGRAIGMLGKSRYVARRLKRIMLAKERKTNRPIMLRVQGVKGRTRYLVTEPLLRKRCPELFDRTDEVAEQLSQTVAILKQQISELFKQDEALKETIRILKSPEKGPHRTVEDPPKRLYRK